MRMFVVPLSFEDSGLEEGDMMSLGEWFEILQSTVPSSSGPSCQLGLTASEDEGTMNFAMACITHPTIQCNILEDWHFQLYNIIFEYGFPVKLVRLIRMCLIETYSRVDVGKHLFDIFIVAPCIL
jgi:hypothetical protein